MQGRKNFEELDQLASVLEKLSDQERDAHLSLIESTDVSKATMLRLRLMTVDRILSLDEESLGRILENTGESILALALKGVDLELRQRALRLVHAEKKRLILNKMRADKATDSEILMAKVKMISLARNLENKGFVSLGALRSPARLKKAA